MLKKYNRHFHLTPGLSPEAKLALQNYAWPGNVRELENVVQRALILCSGESIQVEDFLFEDDSGLPGGVENPTQYHDQPGGLDQGLRSVEEKIILETLLEENGSRKSTAQRLGISQRTLRYKLARMRESGLVVPGI
jgi:two-component system response regulator FlrC